MPTVKSTLHISGNKVEKGDGAASRPSAWAHCPGLHHMSPPSCKETGNQGSASRSERQGDGGWSSPSLFLPQVAYRKLGLEQTYGGAIRARWWASLALFIHLHSPVGICGCSPQSTTYYHFCEYRLEPFKAKVPGNIELDVRAQGHPQHPLQIWALLPYQGTCSNSGEGIKFFLRNGPEMKANQLYNQLKSYVYSH